MGDPKCLFERPLRRNVELRVCRVEERPACWRRLPNKQYANLVRSITQSQLIGIRHENRSCSSQPVACTFERKSCVTSKRSGLALAFALQRARFPCDERGAQLRGDHRRPPQHAWRNLPRRPGAALRASAPLQRYSVTGRTARPGRVVPRRRRGACAALSRGPSVRRRQAPSRAARHSRLGP